MLLEVGGKSFWTTMGAGRRREGREPLKLVGREDLRSKRGESLGCLLLLVLVEKLKSSMVMRRDDSFADVREIVFKCCCCCCGMLAGMFAGKLV